MCRHIRETPYSSGRMIKRTMVRSMFTLSEKEAMPFLFHLRELSLSLSLPPSLSLSLSWPTDQPNRHSVTQCKINGLIQEIMALIRARKEGGREGHSQRLHFGGWPLRTNIGLISWKGNSFLSLSLSLSLRS